MAGTLDEFFVSIGVKGQNVVLSNIAKVKKEANNLSKLKPVIDMGKSNISKAMSSVKSMASMAGITGQAQITTSSTQPNPEQKKEDKQQEKNINKFSYGAKQFGNATKDFASSAATFDPLNVIKSASSGLGTALSGISVLGNTLGQLPKGLSDITNSMVDMASGALTMAKQSAEGAYGLSARNSTTKYYGGDEVNKGGMSNSEHAQLVMAISSSFGKIKKPMQDVLNELVDKKDTAALSRVASGNWESTGTDKGWMLQQITNQTAGLPPSVAQIIQTSLLKNNSELIQSKEGQVGQETNAGFKNRAESQTFGMFQATTAGDAATTFKTMDQSLNKMQLQLVDTGVQFAGAIVTATNALAEFPKTIKKMVDTANTVMDKLHIPSEYRPTIPRFDK